MVARRALREAPVMLAPARLQHPIAHAPQDGDALWFLGVLKLLTPDAVASDGRVGVLEQVAPRGAGSPLHVHRDEDEWFYVIEGELTFWIGGESITAPAGSFVYGPRDIPHTFVVSSDEARFLFVAEPSGFERSARARSVPTARLEDPPAASERDVARLAALAAERGVDILGPPGIPSDS
jgi:quercetin dioxygenase-like cupin family protein